MTYREVWSNARAGTYPQTLRGLRSAWHDSATALVPAGPSWSRRYPTAGLCLAVIALGYGQPSALAWDDQS